MKNKAINSGEEEKAVQEKTAVYQPAQHGAAMP